jgi:2-oxo-4-hydroxy-4-carboxy--5-ureidoimidazoline (OHCU) decarboxylase
MDFDVFVETFGNVIEHSALVTAALWTKRPFSSLQNVVDQINAIVDTLPTDGELFLARNICLLQCFFCSL